MAQIVEPSLSYHLHSSQAPGVCPNRCYCPTREDASSPTSVLQQPVRRINKVAQSQIPFGHWLKTVWTVSTENRTQLQFGLSLRRPCIRLKLLICVGRVGILDLSCGLAFILTPLSGRHTHRKVNRALPCSLDAQAAPPCLTSRVALSFRNANKAQRIIPVKLTFDRWKEKCRREGPTAGPGGGCFDMRGGFER